MFCKTNVNVSTTTDPEVLLGFTVTGYSGVYDGSSHTITATVNPDYQSTTTIHYSTNGTSWSTTKPTRTNAGTTTVYVRATNTTLGTYSKETSIVVSKALVTLTAGSLTATYNRSTQTVYTYSSSVYGLRFSGVSASGSGKNVGTYPVTFSGVTLDVTTDTTGNYVVHTLVEGTITITKASASTLGLSVSSYNGNYDGYAHSVSASVNDYTGTTIQYSTNGSSWSTTAPSRTNVGTTTVYVRALNDNYETATATGTITINEAHSTLIVNWFSGEYCSLYDPDGDTVFSVSTSGYWSGNPTKTGTYRAICPQRDPQMRTVNVTSTTTGTFYIAW